MKIAVGSDHAGWKAKEELRAHLVALGHEVADAGTGGEASCDYPDFAFQVAERVGRGEAERGLLVCGSGIGMAIAANKVKGVRAVACESAFAAEMSRRHNDTNVLCLGARQTPAAEQRRFLELWLATPFEGGRHAGRVGKIGAYEAGRA